MITIYLCTIQATFHGSVMMRALALPVTLSERGWAISAGEYGGSILTDMQEADTAENATHFFRRNGEALRNAGDLFAFA